MKYWLHPEAATEHKKQVAYYEERQPGLGRRYHDDYRAALGIVCKTPHRFRVVIAPEIRRLAFKVFPFDLIYRNVNNNVEVLAIAAHRRKPHYWHQRA